MHVVTASERTILRELEDTRQDAAFILELVREPSWLRFIGDRGVTDLQGARAYLRRAILASYERHGFGLWGIRLRGGEMAGICGILKRDWLPDPDLGFALLERHAGRGLATEASAAAIEHARDELGLRRLAAITDPENAASARVLEKLGFRFERRVPLGEGPGMVRLFVREEAAEG